MYSRRVGGATKALLLVLAQCVHADVAVCFEPVLGHLGRERPDQQETLAALGKIRTACGGYLPMLAAVNPPRGSEAEFVRQQLLPPGSIAVFDNSCVTFVPLAELAQRGVFFVTRIKVRRDCIAGSRPEHRQFPERLAQQWCCTTISGGQR